MIQASFAAGWNAFTRRWGVLVLASALFLAAAAPLQWLAYEVGQSLQDMSRIGTEIHRNKGEASLDEAQKSSSELAAACVPCCCGMCGNILLTIFLVAPVVAGATVTGAQAAAGRTAAPHLFAGFRRYGAVIWVGTLCIVLGGGVIVMASAIASVGARVGVTAAADLTEEVVGKGAELVVWAGTALLVASMIWFSARLWLALYRLVDPVRPRVRAAESLRWSWKTTSGAPQWRILGVLLLLGVIAGVLQIPGEWLMVQKQSWLQATGWAVSIALALFFWLPLVLAVSGALYEQLAPPVDPATAAAASALPPIDDSAALS